MQGPFRYHQQTLQEYWLEQQIPTGTKTTEEASASAASIANNGLYLESFSSSTDPSFYRATTSHDDTNLDDDDCWLQTSTSPAGHIWLQDGERTPKAAPAAAVSPRPVLLKTPSLVDELLSEIYARFGDGLGHYSTRMILDSSQRASASGSQVSIHTKTFFAR